MSEFGPSQIQLVDKLSDLFEASSLALSAMTNNEAVDPETVKKILNLQKEIILCLSQGVNKYSQKDRRTWAQLQRLYNEIEITEILTYCNIHRTSL
jgi:hypothetical protein